MFLGGEFTIDHRGKHISFDFTDNVLDATKAVELQNVVEEHSTEVKVEDEDCDYSEAKNLVYKDCDHEMWKYYSCDWFVEGWQHRAIRYKSMSELLAANKGYYKREGQRGRNAQIDKLLYAEDCDAYFIIRTISRQMKVEHRTNVWRVYYVYTCRLQPVNLFGGRIVNDDEDADSEEIEFVPA